LQAREVPLQLTGRFADQSINPPVALATNLNKSMALKVTKVLGYFNLGLPENFLKMADAQRTLRQKMQDAQPGDITHALVNADQLHACDRTGDFTCFKGNMLL
jgi:hypothetical protein